MDSGEGPSYVFQFFCAPGTSATPDLTVSCSYFQLPSLKPDVTVLHVRVDDAEAEAARRSTELVTSLFKSRLVLLSQ